MRLVPTSAACVTVDTRPHKDGDAVKLTTFNELDERQISGCSPRTMPPRSTRADTERQQRRYKPTARSLRARSWLQLLLARA